MTTTTLAPAREFMRLWIDTEFNDFRGALISMAIVSEAGHQFYEVLECERPSAWIALNVMPILDKAPVEMWRFRQLLYAFLSGFDAVHLVADWPEDIAHFCNALISGPGTRINTPSLTLEIRRDLDAISAIPHNALADALAMRDKHLSLEAK